MQIITSNSNEKIKWLRRLYTKKGREELKLFVAEGEKFVGEIPGGWHVERFYLSQSYYEKKGPPDHDGVIVVKDEILGGIADSVTPQGIVAAVRQKEFDLNAIIAREKPLLALCDNIYDPGNLGAVIRCADAFSADGVITSGVEALSPKVVRASAGSIFHIPVISFDIFQICGILKCKGIKIAASCLEGGAYPEDVDFTGGTALLTGSEARGLDPRLIALADYRVKIPMTGKSQSLNAAVAAGILLYEAQRQRNYK